MSQKAVMGYRATTTPECIIARLNCRRRPNCRRPNYRATLYLLLLTIAGTSLVNVGVTASSSSIPARRFPLADLSACPKLRIAIINQVVFHFEVLAGLLHLFEPHAHQTDVFVHPAILGAGGVGAWDILRTHNSTFYFLNATTHALINSAKLSYDLVVLVSPEYMKAEVHDMLSHMSARAAVAYAHNIGNREGIQELVNAATQQGRTAVKLVTLSPHTSKLLAAIVGQRVDWVLSAYPFQPSQSCMQVPEADLLGGCLRGFCVQGTLEGSRRGYGRLWADLEARRAALTSGAAARLFHVNVLGKGNRSACAVPDSMQQHVTVSTDVPFPAFYNAIHHSLALVPALANGMYLRNKFTSSLLSSLITGTPLMANRTFLQSYAMLSEKSVYLRVDGEGEVDAMLRLVSAPAAEIQAVRRGLLEVRRRLNGRAAAYFGVLLKGLCSSAG